MTDSAKRWYCPICRLEVTGLNGTMMGAFGRPLFAVHNEPCRQLVTQGSNTALQLLLKGAENVLKIRAPRAFAVLQGTRHVVRRLHDGQ
jgi:hypothetical protein